MDYKKCLTLYNSILAPEELSSDSAEDPTTVLVAMLPLKHVTGMWYSLHLFLPVRIHTVKREYFFVEGVPKSQYTFKILPCM